MTTNITSCAAFHERLMAYLEDETDVGTRAAVERHAASCAECGAVLADLRQLRNDAANLPELVPSRDLWSGIAERIEAPVVPIDPRAPVVRRFRARRAWQVGLIAASLAGAAAVGYVAGRRPMTEGTVRIARDSGASPTREPSVPEPATVVAAAPVSSESPVSAPATAGARRASPDTASPPGAAPAGAVGTQLVVATLTADYDREIARLTRLIESRRNQMDPATVAIIERNLQIIDAAITDSKLAIARDPASRFLIESLNQSLQMKVELMRTAAMLPSRT